MSNEKDWSKATKEEVLLECKLRYPVGTKFICSNTKTEATITTGLFTIFNQYKIDYNINEVDSLGRPIKTYMTHHCVFCRDSKASWAQWAQIIDEPLPIADNLEISKPKPPLGLMPESIHRELRIKEINEAIERYESFAIKLDVPKEWRDELFYLSQSRKERKDEVVKVMRDLITDFKNEQHFRKVSVGRFESMYNEGWDAGLHKAINIIQELLSLSGNNSDENDVDTSIIEKNIVLETSLSNNQQNQKVKLGIRFIHTEYGSLCQVVGVHNPTDKGYCTFDWKEIDGGLLGGNCNQNSKQMVIGRIINLKS